MNAAPAGWYPDPSGIPNAFRWWDGGTWTTAIGASAQAPPPRNAAPAGPPPDTGATGAPSQGVVGGTPAAETSHPGPDFEPAAWQRHEQPASYVTPPVPPASGMSTGKVIALFAGVLVLVLAVGAAYLGLRNTRQGPPPVPTPTPTVTTQTVPPGTPPPSTPPPSTPPPTTAPPTSPPPSTAPPNSQSPIPPPTSTPQPAEPHLVFSKPAAPWAARGGLLTEPDVTEFDGYSVLTEPNYAGTSSWVAIMLTMNPDPAWGIGANQQTGLATASRWYQASNFGGAAIVSRVSVDKRTTVAGEPGWARQEHLSYSIPGLRSTGETVTWVSVQTAKGASSVFLSSIPDTDKNLQADATKAITTLRIEK